MISHEGRVAVVTGAARGIGQAICRRLAAEGAVVVAVDITAPTETLAEIHRHGGTATANVVDVSDPTGTQSIGAEVQERYGRCDILVNNAGIYPFIDIDDLDYDTWRKVLAVNLDSQFLMTKTLLPLMKSGQWGRIVNLTSNSIGLAVPGLTHYMASKMGTIGFTRALANDVAAQGITVNAVGPTLSRTPGVTSAVDSALQEQVAQSQAIKKVGEADDVVGTVMFLTSEDSYFVTGQTIMADGGLVRL
ncbi:(S)-1-Phenylethanol dehydrogenase [Nocardia cerradoensis]|uniref:3-oxoacyl-[acyl-carrier-protein] reductase MabA n=1 Tax=Nocardia cerradoensis TaxID=85688 RepID=A0A231H498_9NOCA|nr:SDR family oxidoreductase [Nocardia cerradoensis]OXR43658.1 (S)-1-Phenylethanol dehydrogenase [Nocardia cerradoensis]